MFVSAYHLNDRQHGDLLYDLTEDWTNLLDWEDGQGGSAYTYIYAHYRPELPEQVTVAWPATSWPQALPAGAGVEIDWDAFTNYSIYADLPTFTNNYNAAAPVLAQEHCDLDETYSYDAAVERRTADTEMKLATGGPLGSKQQNLWCLSAGATDAQTGQPIPYDQISIGSLGNLDTNGELWVVLPDNDPPVVTPKVKWKKNYKFTVSGRNTH